MYALMVNLKSRNVIGRSLAADAPPTGQSASAAPPEYTTIQSGRRLPFSPMHMDNSLHSCAGSSGLGSRCYLDSRRRVGLQGCLFAMGSDMTTEEEIGNITDYLTDSFQRPDLRLEVSQSAIREK